MADNKLEFDVEGGVKNTLEFRNYTKVIFTHYSGVERHVTITYEGVVTDIVKDGEVINSSFTLHEDLLDGEC